MRSVNFIKNAVAGIMGQFITLLLGFATRTAFVYTLGAELLGINGLFTSVLTVLNLAELGFGSAIVYAMYKPLAYNDIEKIKSLMDLYRLAFCAIGWFLLIFGSALIPFLDSIIKEEITSVNVKFVFFLYILNSVSTYWFFAYKSAILNADQKAYIITTISNAAKVFVTFAMMLALFFLRHTPAFSFYIYTIIGIAGNIVINLFVKRQVDQLYPFLKETNISRLVKDEKQAIYKNILGLSLAKISGIMINAADNIIISVLIGITTVGLYSNFLLLTASVASLLGAIFTPITSSIGNLCSIESVEKQENFFKTLQFLYFWVIGFCAISFYILLNPFVGGVWLNPSYMMSDTVVILISLNFLLDGLSGAVIKFREANGLFWYTRYRYLFSAFFNAVVSVILAGPLRMGINGVLLGTTCSILILVSFDPIIVFKYVFKQSPVRYYFSYLLYLALITITAIFTKLLSLAFNDNTMQNFVIKVLLCVLVPNGLWWMLFHRNENFLYLVSLFKSVMNFSNLSRNKDRNR